MPEFPVNHLFEFKLNWALPSVIDVTRLLLVQLVGMTPTENGNAVFQMQKYIREEPLTERRALYFIGTAVSSG